jgi:aspergillopepsin I
MAGGADPHHQTYILGDTFLRNIVAVFDVGAAELRFAPNVYYESSKT